MVIRMRHNRSQTGQHRSHHALKSKTPGKCPKCGAAILPHRMCANCGFYRDREVINTVKKAEKRAKKAKQRGK